MYINIIELLESIGEACAKQTSCEECPFMRDYGDPERYNCGINDTPDRWRIDSAYDAEVLLDVTDFEKKYIMEVEG